MLKIAKLILWGVVGWSAWMYWSGGFDKKLSAEINNTVTKDMEEQFWIVAKGDDHMAKCVQAGMVAQAYLQAKDEGKYQQWKMLERSWGKAAKAVAEIQ